MAYTEAAKERRRCTGTRKDGEPCRAWAVWGEWAEHLYEEEPPAVDIRQPRRRRSVRD